MGCEVRWATLGQAGAAAALARDDERRRAARFVRAADRERSLLGSVLLRVAAAAALGTGVDEVRLTRTCPRCGTSAAPDAHGRPAVAGSDLGLTSSHAGDVVVVATAGRGVGVDVEPVRRLDDAVLADVLAPDEPHPGPGGEATALWVRKESVLKATGEGLTVPPRRVRLTPLPGRGGAWAAVREGDGADPARHGTTWDLVTAADHPTALTLLDPGSAPATAPRPTRWPAGAGGAGT